MALEVSRKSLVSGACKSARRKKLKMAATFLLEGFSYFNNTELKVTEPNDLLKTSRGPRGEFALIPGFQSLPGTLKRP